ncbi:hypothetical protein H9L39_17273 [Fusarium oxysporum f. sp. albedinis]|nr:hypothetical protein H9L39_17273 [Fusarium oxysporum f. sp. albedinis]
MSSDTDCLGWIIRTGPSPEARSVDESAGVQNSPPPTVSRLADVFWATTLQLLPHAASIRESYLDDRPNLLPCALGSFSAAATTSTPPPVVSCPCSLSHKLTSLRSCPSPADDEQAPT